MRSAFGPAFQLIFRDLAIAVEIHPRQHPASAAFIAFPLNPISHFFDGDFSVIICIGLIETSGGLPHDLVDRQFTIVVDITDSTATSVVSSCVGMITSSSFISGDNG